MPTEMASNINQQDQASSQANETAMKEAPLKAEEPSGEEVEVAKVFIVEAPVVVAENTTKKLPQTASQLPLLYMSGIFLMALGVLFWTLSKRRA
jgi:LPXTG-motif cell wall-anchored protein